MKTSFLFLLSTLSIPSYPPSWTPGSLNPDITQSNISTTICAASWTKTVRPPVKFTDSLKIKQMARMGLSSNSDPHKYEEDHRVPLELGGAPLDPSNLWPEPWPEARKKDRLETAVKKDVCAGKLTLKQGRSIFLGDFWAEYTKRFGLY